MWSGPDAQGWYEWSSSETYEGTEFSTSFHIRLTPDVWVDGNEGLQVTKVEFVYTYSMSDQTMGSMTISGDMDNEFNTGRTHVSGSSTVNISIVSPAYESGSGDFSVNATWTDVAVDPDDYSGDFGIDMTIAYSGIENQVPISVDFQFSTVFSFEVDGSGTGNTSFNDEEAIQFVFEAVTSAYERSGYYTLASENFETQHPFTVYSY
ncbi:MAG: hypothetical protein V2A56_05010 [bacterium]